MSTTGFWYVSHVSDDAVREVLPRVDPFLSWVEADREASEALVEWRQAPTFVHGPEAIGHVLTPPSERFLDAFVRTQADQELFLACSIDETANETWDLSEMEHPEHCRALFAGIRKLPVVSLLYLGLGPERSRLLPGVMGNLILTSGEVEAAADAVRKAHILSPAEKADAIERMHAWLYAGDDFGFPVRHLLEALPLVFSTAVEMGSGIIGLTASF